MAATPQRIQDDDPLGKYRLLVVPGIFGECVQDVALPWEDARRHLHEKHNADVEYVSVPATGSSSFNANVIATYVDRQFAGSDQRPYIMFGYSKGASDILEALVRYPAIQAKIAAVVTIAGAVFGSRLTQGIPTDLLAQLKHLKLGPCSIGDGGGIDSLRRRERAASVSQLPAGLRAYSITATSRLETTSVVLANGWRQLQAYSIDQDSQMIREDAIVPGGAYLGTALADHWAVALPFEHVAEFHPNTSRETVTLLHNLINHNHYPRAALFESALRFALADLNH
jgi:hypothetical protein